MSRTVAPWFVAMAAALAMIALAAPDPNRETDRAVYEATASRFVVPGCVDLHCFRVLVPWLLGPMPGASIVKWKTYAVVANLIAAVSVFALSLRFGLSRRGAVLASALSAFGFGSLYTLFDPFTSDPLMYALGPLIVLQLMRERMALAGVVAAVGVLAKEFAAAPALMFAAATAMSGRAALAWRALAWSAVPLVVWLSMQAALIVLFNYRYGPNPSTRVLSGGYLAHWLSHLSWKSAVLALYGELGVMWILAPFGFVLANAPLQRLAMAAIPVAMIFAYVQQPDRALWNFHFIVAPLSAIVLDRAPAAAAWACVAAFALANLRLGAQLPQAPAAAVSLAASLAIAIGCVFNLRRPARLATA